MITTEQRLHALLHGLGLSTDSINKVKLYNAEQIRDVGKAISDGRLFDVSLDRQLNVKVKRS
jgi:hypothetical protein